MGKKKAKRVSIEQEYERYDIVSKDFYERIMLMMNGITEMKLKDLMMDVVHINKMKRHKLKFVLYTVPKGASRPRYRRMGNHIHTYVPNADSMNKFFRKYLIENFGSVDIIYTACRLKCKYYLPIPSSGMTKNEKILAEAEKILPLKKPDWDNLGKTTDIMNGSIWIDDSLVVKAVVEKFYSSKPRMEIIVQYDKDFDSEFNKKAIMKSKVFQEMKENGLIREYHEN